MLSCFVLIFISYATWPHFFSVHYPQNRCKIWRGLPARHDVTLTVLNSRVVKDVINLNLVNCTWWRRVCLLFFHILFCYIYVLKFSIVFEIWSSTVVECFQVSWSFSLALSVVKNVTFKSQITLINEFTYFVMGFKKNIGKKTPVFECKRPRQLKNTEAKLLRVFNEKIVKGAVVLTNILAVLC